MGLLRRQRRTKTRSRLRGNVLMRPPMLSRISNTLSWAAIAAVFVFLIMPAFVFAAAKEKILLNFNGTDGGGSEAGLIFDQAGNLYGTAGGGGSYGGGTVFEVSAGGDGPWTVTLLGRFADNAR